MARALWDPNPQLKLLQFGRTSLYHWTDASGKSWTGGLYLPPGYHRGSRYPLVLQTHGFFAEQFRPSGMYAEGYAARELAAAGIVVLEVPDCKNAYSGTADEGPCAERLYQGAVEQLVRDGMIDPSRVGITGFSRSCFYVMDLLTKRTFPIRAAIIIDGVNFGYLEYLTTAMEFGGSVTQHTFDSVIGARPWGAGLRTWLEHSPEFNLDKVDAPLEVIAPEPGRRALDMWEPFAILKTMNKPVDMLVLRTDEHPTWQPAARLASQQDAVDWYRFWLQGYEDPNPAKAELYKKWRKLRELDARAAPASRSSAASPAAG
jgi:dipeptidyl aminopeptidase/acylaminoacyl peptidase